MTTNNLLIIITFGVIALILLLCYKYFSVLINRKLASIVDNTDRTQYYLQGINDLESYMRSHIAYTMMLAVRSNPSVFLIHECDYLQIRQNEDESIRYPDILEYILLSQAYSQLGMLKEGRKCFDEGMQVHPDLRIWKNRDELIRRLYEDNLKSTTYDS